MVETKRLSLIKPTEKTPFHIDFKWWKDMDQNWHVDLISMLCPEHSEVYNTYTGDNLIDWVDEETGEVRAMDGLQHIITSHCAKQANFLTEHTTLVDSVFKTFLSNGNYPMSSIELGKHLNRSSDMILRTLSGPRVYKGIRPYSN